MEAPGKGKPVKKEFEGKQYHWCPGHKFWTMHSPTDCTLLHPDKKLSSIPPGKKSTPAKKLTFAEAAIAAMEADDQEEEQADSEMRPDPGIVGGWDRGGGSRQEGI
jgi:hypothetical protein